MSHGGMNQGGFAVVPRRRLRGRAATWLAALAVVTLPVLPVTPASAASPPPVRVPVLHWVDCGGGFQCANAPVPLDYANPQGPTIALALIRRRAGDPAHRIGSLFVNPGGPGGSGVDFVRGAAVALWSPEVRAHFDIVGFDPRGVARSTPIQCFASNAAENRFLASIPASFPVGRDQEVHYISTFEQFDGICLQHNATIMQHMATADVARDMDLLRQAVGDQLLTYDGVSYGSYLGNTYANLFPTKVRALIIDGVLDPVAWATGDDNGFSVPFSTRLNSARGAYQTLLQFFTLCKRSGSDCAFSAGDPRAKYYTLLARARQHPIIVGPDRFTFADIVSLTLGALFSPFDWPQLGQLLQLLYSRSPGSGAAAQSLIAALRSTSATPYYNGLEAFLGVACSDTDNPSDPFVWPRAAAKQDQQSPYFGSAWTWASEPCSTWPARDKSRYVGPFNHRTANPVLVIGNFYDPATPYQGAQAVANMLPGSRLLSMAGWGHTSLGKSACVDNYVTAYLVRQALPPDGNVCQPDSVPFEGPHAVDSAHASALARLIPAPIIRGLSPPD